MKSCLSPCPGTHLCTCGIVHTQVCPLPARMGPRGRPHGPMGFPSPPPCVVLSMGSTPRSPGVPSRAFLTILDRNTAYLSCRSLFTSLSRGAGMPQNLSLTSAKALHTSESQRGGTCLAVSQAQAHVSPLAQKALVSVFPVTAGAHAHILRAIVQF